MQTTKVEHLSAIRQETYRAGVCQNRRNPARDCAAYPTPRMGIVFVMLFPIAGLTLEVGCAGAEHARNL